MGMKKVILYAFLLSHSLLLAGGDQLISERPGQALSPVCLQEGQFQIQSGINRNDFNNHNLSGSITNAVLRFGLGERFEINSNFDYDNLNGKMVVPFIGFKAALFNDTLNQVSIQYNSYLHQFFDNPYSANLKFIGSHSITDKTGFAWNAGLIYTPISEDLSANYVASFSFNPTSKIGMVLENYGNYENELKTYFDFGIGYLVSPVFQLDTYFGGGINDGEEEYFVNFGFTYRIDYN